MKGPITKIGVLFFSTAFICFSAIGALTTLMIQTGIIKYALLIVGFSIAGTALLMAGFESEGLKEKIISGRK